MKFKTCPKCGSSLGQQWTAGRKLQQYCPDNEHIDCAWVGEPQTPTRRKIPNTKTVVIDTFTGWQFTIYDKYGHEHTCSRTYSSKQEAVKEIVKRITAAAMSVYSAAPLTAVLVKVPFTVEIKGTKFKFKRGKVREVR
jgi:hypothetical protein